MVRLGSGAGPGLELEPGLGLGLGRGSGELTLVRLASCLSVSMRASEPARSHSVSEPSAAPAAAAALRRCSVYMA